MRPLYVLWGDRVRIRLCLSELGRNSISPKFSAFSAWLELLSNVGHSGSGFRVRATVLWVEFMVSVTVKVNVRVMTYPLVGTTVNLVKRTTHNLRQRLVDSSFYVKPILDWEFTVTLCYAPKNI